MENIQEIKDKVQGILDLRHCTTVSDANAMTIVCDLEKAFGSRLLLNPTDIARKNANGVTLVVITKLGGSPSTLHG